MKCLMSGMLTGCGITLVINNCGVATGVGVMLAVIGTMLGMVTLLHKVIEE